MKDVGKETNLSLYVIVSVKRPFSYNVSINSNTLVKSGYTEIEIFRKGPCNECRNRNLQCVRVQKGKGDVKTLGGCRECIQHCRLCVWGRHGEIRFRSTTASGVAYSPFPRVRRKKRRQDSIETPESMNQSGHSKTEILAAIRRLSSSLQENLALKGFVDVSSSYRNQWPIEDNRTRFN